MTDRELQEEAISSALSANTRVAYRKGWRRFTDYCVAESVEDPLSASPDSVARFFVHLATRPNPRSGIVPSMGTVAIYKSALSRKYADAGKPSPTDHPTVKATLKGLARLKGSAVRRVDALREYQIAAMIEACPNTTIGFQRRRNHRRWVRGRPAPFGDMQLASWRRGVHRRRRMRRGSHGHYDTPLQDRPAR